MLRHVSFPERARDVLNCLCLVSGRAVLFMLIGAFWRVILPLVFSATLPPTWLLAAITAHHVAGSLYLVVNWVVCVASVPDESDPDASGGKEEAFAPGFSELLVRHPRQSLGRDCQKSIRCARLIF